MSEWSKTPPTVAGWYWCKGCCVVRGCPTMPLELYFGGEDDETLGAFSDRHDEFLSADNIGSEWWTTPIEPPA